MTSFSEPFIHRPVATTLIMAAIVIFGAMAYRHLPVSDLPNVDFPTILVEASLPGASPETMASSVATPLEKEFSTIQGIKAMTSTSSLGATQVVLQFELDRSVDFAAQDVQAAINQASALLPPDLPSPPTIRKVNPADQPVLYVALTSRALPIYEVDEYAETTMAQRISMVSGVAQVQVFGAQKYAVRVRLDPAELASRGIGIDEVADAVRSANPNLPTGTLYGSERAYTIRATGQITRAEPYRRVVVTWREGRPVRLEDLGTVVDGVQDDKALSWYVDEHGRQRAIVLAIQRQPGTNAVEVTRSVKELFPRFRELLPAAVETHLLFDRSESILDSFHEVRSHLLLALVLVVLAIFLFLRKLSATVIPSLALPMSIIGTFAAMYALGYSLNNLSLMSLTLAVGFVVDDAIVVLENVVRHIEMGKGRLEAALEGSREIGFTIVSMTLSLAAVFIPVVFMPGIIGRLFNEFAVTICVAILISGFVSLTLTPMLCSRFLRVEHGGAEQGRFHAATERAFDALYRLYERSLRAVLRHRAAVMVLSLVVLLATAVLFARIPKGFIPDEDQGAIFGITEAAQGASFEEMVRQQARVLEAIEDLPHLDSLFAALAGSSGGGVSTTANQGRVFLHLKERDERPPIAEVIEEVRPKLAGIPGVRAFLQQLPTIRIGGQLTKSLYQYSLQGPDTEDLYASARRLEARLRDTPELVDVTSDLQLTNPQVRVDIDRDEAARLGISAEQIEDALYDAYGERWVSTIYAPNNQYRVILEVEDEHQRRPAALADLYVRSLRGGLVPLTVLTRFEEEVGPVTVNHAGQLPAVTLSFNLAPGVSLGDAVGAVERAAREELSATIETRFQGTAQEFVESLSGLSMLLFAAILVIYIILGILYESFVHPLTILSGLPSAGFGALVTLLFFGEELNVYGFVGLVMLIGIVKKNAIMQIDFALAAQRTEGKAPLEAITQGCLVRFRPIMMTTLAALFGALPIALGLGGGEARRSLGLAVVGGLLFSQLVTLYLTPVYFTYLDALRTSPRGAWESLRRRRSRTRGLASSP